MLQKNKIFLSLLGSFYDDTAYTEFSSRLDYIYTSIIFNRYADTARKIALSSSTSRARGVVHFGIISVTDINPSENTIVVRDINNSPVDNVDFVSLMFLDIEKFYPVDDNVSVPELINRMSSYSMQNIPVLYMKDVDISLSENGLFRFVDSMSNESISDIKASILKMVRDRVSYFPHTVKLFYKMANIILGAEYSISSEKVLYVSDEKVITSKNEYILSPVNIGRAIVDVDDKLEYGDLITEVAELAADMMYISDVSRISSYMKSTMLSSSNSTFLGRLSSAIAKKRVALRVEPDVFSNIDLNALSIVNSIFKLSSAISMNANTGSIDSLDVTAESGSKFLIESKETIDVDISGEWILDIVADNIEIIPEEQFQGIYNDTSNVDFILRMELGAEPVIDGIEAIIEESLSSISEDSLNANLEEGNLKYGLYVDTVISEVSENHSTIETDDSNISISDGGQTFNEGTVIHLDKIYVSESAEKFISAKDASSIIISDIVKTSTSIVDILSASDELLGFTELNSEETLSVSENWSTMETDIFNASVSEGDNADMVIVSNTETIKIDTVEATSGIQEVDFNIEVDMDDGDGRLLLLSKSTVLISDVSDVESENTIDT